MSKKINLLIMEETEFWMKDIQKACEKIYGIYLYCPDEVTHCCELTPSYECHFVRSVSKKLPVDEEERDELLEDLEIGDGERDLIDYYHCSTIDNLPDLNRELKVGTSHFNDYEEEDFDWDDVIEDYVRNPWY